MARMMYILMVALTAGGSALAQDLPDLSCTGTADWSLQTEGDRASWRDRGRGVSMTIPLVSRSRDGNSVWGLTLISRTHTAIAIVRERSCNGQPFEVDVLTQNLDVPVIYSGCCVVAAE